MFLFTFTSFGVVLLLGGPRHATLEVEIYRQTAELLDLPVAAALALVQLVAVVALLLVAATRIAGAAGGRNGAAPPRRDDASRPHARRSASLLGRQPRA